jgi:hypothetical protein
MRNGRSGARAAVLAGALTCAAAAQAGSGTDGAGLSPYAGQETRAIKSLSESDIAELRRGGGWGLAKAAELNGVPGPAHLLELKDQIPLTEAQEAEIRAIFERMQAEAITAGERLIALEAELEADFRAGTVTGESLRESLAKIAAARAELRFVHLSTHLKTPAILSKSQIARYNALRGYGEGDPCAQVPEGHDPAMWRRHNGCD